MLSLSLQDRLFNAFPTLETPRLVLRAMSPADAQELFRVCSDARVAEHQDWAPFTRLSEATQLINERLDLYRRRVRVSWGLCLAPNGPLIGQIGMHSLSLRDRRAELAFDLRSDYWRQGLMTEALRAVSSFAFERCQLNKLVAQTVVENAACHELLVKLGFEIEGRLPAHYHWKGAFRDVHLYGLVGRCKAGT
ncbi:MAG: GNAT family protein [Myxococcales bacterium]|jgi:ribosomal-protein-alanine N-acetyltransferase